MSNMEETIRIIIADDHAVVRDGMSALLKEVKGIAVVGTATDGEAVLQQLSDGLEADIILADLDMPVMSGTELVKKLRATDASIKVIMLTMHQHEKYIAQAFEAGADGYLSKQTEADELIFALQRVFKSGNYISQSLVETYLKRIRRTSELQPPEEAAEFSNRELEVLALVAEGYTNQEIADRIFSSKRTVEGIRLGMLQKTSTRNSAALIRYAMQHGLLR